MSERRKITPLLVAGATLITAPAQAQPAQIAAPAQAQPAQNPATAQARSAQNPAPAQAQPESAPAEPARIAPPAAQAAAPRAPDASLTIGQQENFTRLAFSFPAPATVTPLLSGEQLELRFSRAADIDLAEARAALPRFVRALTRVSQPGQPLRLRLAVDPGVRQRHFVDGTRVVVDLMGPDTSAPAAPQTASAAPGAPSAARSEGPAPPSGAASVRLSEDANATSISVRWATPARAAAFRRGEAIYLLFEANGTIDLRGLARAGRRHRDLEIVSGDGVTGLRIPAAPDILVSARAEGPVWTFTLSPRAESRPSAPVQLSPEAGGRLQARFGRDGIVRSVQDPEIGDRFLVALMSGPVIGLDQRRSTIEAAFLPSAQGAVIEPRADGVGAAFENGVLIVARGAGLVSAPAERARSAENAAELEAALIARGEDGAVTAFRDRAIRDRLDDLTRRAASEGVAEGAPVTARLALAEFLLENELAPEALGALRLAALNQPAIELDPKFRLMRAAANVMMYRPEDAMADLDSSILQGDPSAALWRGYAAALQRNWAEARRDLERGAGALEQHPPNWRARFALALAESAVEVNDLAAAELAARAAIGQASTHAIRLHARLIEARIMAARGATQEALALLDELSGVRDEEVAVRANLVALKMRRASGELSLTDAAERLEALRYRWRGDSLEIDIVGALGAMYAEMSRWREALATMRVAAERFPMDPASRTLRGDMQAIFTRLFLDGEADKLEPIQALGLFYEFTDLTPIGPDGDRIVRALAGRLVGVDLLEQASNLLQHQVDERLEGIGKAQVASELAAIYLMDRKPEQALTAINGSRLPNLPRELLAQRRILEARAHLDLGRLDHAVELVERDQGADAQRVRAEAAWRARDWERAAAELRTLLRLKPAGAPLDAEWRQVVLRAGVALTLSQNETGLRDLYRAHAADMRGTSDSDSFEIVAGGVTPENAGGLREVARAVARTDLLARFLQNMRMQMTADPSAAPATAQAARPAAPAPAAQAPAPAPNA